MRRGRRRNRRRGRGREGVGLEKGSICVDMRECKYEWRSLKFDRSRRTWNKEHEEKEEV